MARWTWRATISRWLNVQCVKCGWTGCARGAVGPLGSPGCSGNAGGCAGIQPPCSFPPRPGTAALSASAQQGLSTAALADLIQRPTANKTLKMRSWPNFLFSDCWGGKTSLGSDHRKTSLCYSLCCYTVILLEAAAIWLKNIRCCSPPR